MDIVSWSWRHNANKESHGSILVHGSIRVHICIRLLHIASCWFTLFTQFTLARPALTYHTHTHLFFRKPSFLFVLVGRFNFLGSKL